jgi:hypothetical protein
MPVALFASLAVLSITLWEVWRALAVRSAPGLLLLSIVGVTVLGPFGLAMVQPFFLPERTLIVALPALVILVAWGIVGAGRRAPLRALSRPPSDSPLRLKMSKNKGPLPILGIGLGLVILISLGGYYFSPAFQKPPMREAAAFVQERFAPGDAVLHTSDGSYLPFLVYAHPPESYLLRGDPDSRKPEEVYKLWGGKMADRGDLESRFHRLWLVVALDHSLAFQQEALDWFQRHYVMLEQNGVGGIGVYLFSISNHVGPDHGGLNDGK